MTNPRQDKPEERAIAILKQVIRIHGQNRDALPGSVVKLVRQAIIIMTKRRR